MNKHPCYICKPENISLNHINLRYNGDVIYLCDKHANDYLDALIKFQNTFFNTKT